MNMNTIMQELHKKIKLMDKKSFNNFIEQLNRIYKKTHHIREYESEEFLKHYGISEDEE